MADVHSKKVRSFNMSRIKGKDTKPEILVRRFLFSEGLRYRLHGKNLPGKPDIVLSRLRTVIFVNGCFWHGHNCKMFVIPKTRTRWWLNKIETNRKNDENKKRALIKESWKVITVWGCQLAPKKKERTLKKLMDKLLNNASIK